MDKYDKRKLIITALTFMGQSGAVYILLNLVPRNVSPLGKVCGYVGAFLLGNSTGPMIENEILKCEEILRNLGDNRNMVIF